MLKGAATAGNRSNVFARRVLLSLYPVIPVAILRVRSEATETAGVTVCR